MDIPQIVRDLVKRCETRNPFRILEQLGVLLVFYPLDSVNGFYQYFQRNDIIYIDERLSESEILLVCSHELGHMIMHKNTNTVFLDSRTHFNTDRYEIEANKFAINLLITDEEIEEHLDYTTEQFSRLFGYHEKLIELRLKDFI